MTTQSLSWAKSILDTILYKGCEPLTANLHATEQVCALLADEQSRQAYVQELAYKALVPSLGQAQRASQLTGGLSLEQFQADCARAMQDNTLPKTCVDKNTPTLLMGYVCSFYYRQYEYRKSSGETIGPRCGDIMLDCGACFGDTAVWAARYEVNRVYAFEAFASNYEAMCKNIALNGLENRVEPVSCGLARTPGTLWFTPNPGNAGAGIVSAVQQQGSSPIPVTSIDAFCEERAITPDFIKMDIEGSEFEALQGAEQTIRKAAPRLAICLYHHLQDMWRIPLLLKTFVPDYRFYCKKSHPFVEFVLFAEKA